MNSAPVYKDEENWNYKFMGQQNFKEFNGLSNRKTRLKKVV